jgi:hypothetical protein
MESGQHQLALLHVRVLVEQDHRVRPNQRQQHARALTRVQDVGGRGEHLLDLVRIADDDERRGEREPDGEPLAVARAALLEVGVGTVPEADPLNQRRHLGPGR